jgi:hypothetical protein
MARPLVWWQLSDIHWPAHPSTEHTNFVRHLLDELGGPAIDRHGPPAFVAITGDIAATGQEDEYDSVAATLIKPLKDILAKHGDVPMLAVPGNHDLNRRDAKYLSPDSVVSLDSLASVDEFLANQRQMQFYLKPFSDYAQFVSTHISPDVASPISWTKQIDVGGTKVCIVGMNSAWSSHYWHRAASNTDERQLLIGQQQLMDTGDRESTTLYIALAHHPLDWLNREVCSRVDQRLRQVFDAFLFGHVHSPRDLTLTIAPNSRCCLVPSPLLYRSPYEDSIEFARAYAVCTVDVGINELKAQYYRYSDAFGPKFVPYTDLYEPGQDSFKVAFRSPTAKHPSGPAIETQARPLMELLAERMTGLRRQLPEYDDTSASQRHSIEMCRKVLEIVDFSGTPLSSPLAADACALAFVLAEVAVARADSGLVDRAATSARLLHDLHSLTDATPSLSMGDRAALDDLVSRVSLLGHTALANFKGTSTDYASLAFSVAWGIAQISLLIDSPWLIPDYLSGSLAGEVSSSGPNIISIAHNEASGSVVVRLRTNTRTEFHRVVEARHLVEQYFAHAEDMWRRLSLIPPAVRFDFELTQWRHSGVESHAMQVDPKPITRLLMGKALYGDRPHVWLRELIQNAVDATESRRLASADPSYVPEIRVVWHDPHLVTVADNGSGMSHQHVLRYLATLGRSGWRTSDVQGEEESDNSYFGRFGIGFASVFSVASKVTVSTRRTGSRAVDGLRVSFSEPDRPFFLEFVPCPEGTEVRVELGEALPLGGLQSALTDLFVYLPRSVTVEPTVEIPTTLNEYSPSQRGPKTPPLAGSVSAVSEARIGSFEATISSELVLPKASVDRRWREGVARADYSALPDTALDISVDGVRVFKQDQLKLEESGRPAKGRDSSSDASLGFRGYYVAIDFRREESPVLPSRDALDIDEDFVAQFHNVVTKQFEELLPLLAESIASGVNAQTARRRVLRMLVSVIGRSDYVYQRDVSYGRYHSADSVSDVASRTYVERCPGVVRRKDGSRQLVLIGEIDPSQCRLAVSPTISDGKAFQIYAQSRGFDSWFVVEDPVEGVLLKRGWPFEEPLEIIMTKAALMSYIDDIASEVRSGEMVKLLRGDYALVRSDLFSSELFMKVPSEGSSTPRHVGASRSRIEVASTRPRAVLNADHPLIVCIEKYLESGGVQERQLIKSWLRSLSDGVIEDNTVQAPRARWEHLFGELRDIVGTELPNTPFESLRVTV